MLTRRHGEAQFDEHGSAMPLSKKPDGSLRPCTDYRRVNSLTKPDLYLLPRMENCIDLVGSATYVSKFDLLKGYWQVPLTERAKKFQLS